MNTIVLTTLQFLSLVKHRTISLLVGFQLQWHNAPNTVILSNQIGGLPKSTFSQLKTYGEATMDKVQFECRMCKKKTSQIIVKITDLLPPGVETIQCTVCSSMTVAQIGQSNANL
jgi:hypothetical protein